MAHCRHQFRAQSWDADQITAALLQESMSWEVADWPATREACDIATGNEFPSDELDRLTRMVLRRLGGKVAA